MKKQTQKRLRVIKKRQKGGVTGACSSNSFDKNTCYGLIIDEFQNGLNSNKPVDEILLTLINDYDEDGKKPNNVQEALKHHLIENQEKIPDAIDLLKTVISKAYDEKKITLEQKRKILESLDNFNINDTSKFEENFNKSIDDIKKNQQTNQTNTTKIKPEWKGGVPPQIDDDVKPQVNNNQNKSTMKRVFAGVCIIAIAVVGFSVLFTSGLTSLILLGVVAICKENR